MGLLLVFLALVQTTLASDLRVFQVAPDLMIVVTICAGMAGGTQAGAWVGFWAGLLADMFVTTTPVGLSALTYCLVGASIGFVRESFLHDRRLLLPVAGFAGTAAAVLLFVALGDLFGQSQLLVGGRSAIIRVALVEALWSAVLIIPVGFAYTRLARGSVGADRLGPGTGAGTVHTERLVVK